MPSGHKSVFDALTLLAPTPFDEISPNLVLPRSFKKLGGSKFGFFRKFLFSSLSCRICRNTNAGTTMAFVTWRHVPRGTCHVPPREPLAKQYSLDKVFEKMVAETRNFQGRCTPVGYTCHVSDDPEGSKLCPQGTISFSSLMPSSSDTLRWRHQIWYRGCSVIRFKIVKFRGVQKLGGSKF